MTYKTPYGMGAWHGHMCCSSHILSSLLVKVFDLLQVQQARLAPTSLPLCNLWPELRVQIVGVLCQLIGIGK